MKDLEYISNAIDKRDDELSEIATKIWEFAELPYEEFNSSRLLINKLKSEGFNVEEAKDMEKYLVQPLEYIYSVNMLL